VKYLKTRKARLLHPQGVAIMRGREFVLPCPGGGTFQKVPQNFRLFTFSHFQKLISPGSPKSSRLRDFSKIPLRSISFENVVHLP